MNYYEHHIGDFAQATAHLSFVEDAAYSRLLRKYYAEEKPLSADIKAVQRLIGARSREEKEAVATILNEFFVLADDGWHNKRCDSEIARYQDKQAKARRSAEARWHKPPSPSEGNAQAAAAAMRTHSAGSALQAPGAKRQPPDPEQTPQAAPPITPRSNELCRLLAAQGVMLQLADPRLRTWASSGVSDAQLLAALAIAQQRRLEQGTGQPVNAGLLDAILGDVLNKTPRPGATPKRPAVSDDFDNRDYGQGGPL